MFTVFTTEEENLICIYDTTNRKTLIDSIKANLRDYDEAEMREIAEKVLLKLEKINDEEFTKYQFNFT